LSRRENVVDQASELGSSQAARILVVDRKRLLWACQRDRQQMPLPVEKRVLLDIE